MQEPKKGGESYDERIEYWERKPGMSQLKTLVPNIKGRVAMIFTDEFVSKLKPRIESLTIPCRAKVGQIAPVSVKIPKGPTGISPSDIKFFHAVKITSTKIMKGQIEITAPKVILQEGDLVGPSEA